MASRVAVLLAIAVTCFDSAALSQTAPTAIVDLQRLVFGLGDPAFPDTPEKLDAQSELAAAYAVGAGVERDIELACGLAQIARHLAVQGGDDSPSYLRAQRGSRLPKAQRGCRPSA